MHDPPPQPEASSSASMTTNLANTPRMSSSNDLPMPDPLCLRPSLSTSLSDFALSSSTSSSPSSSGMGNGSGYTPLQTKDDMAPILRRSRRPTIHNWWLPESRLQSPLSTSFTIPSARIAKGKGRCVENEAVVEEGSECGFRDKDRMATDSSSPSSESDIPTPPLRLEDPRMDEPSERPKSSPMDISRSASPAASLKPPADILEAPGPTRHPERRLSCPPKPPRLLTLLRLESHPEESEVKSEALFQRYLASHSQSGLPPGLSQSRSGRPPSDRGRYPEEAVGDEDFQREDTPSDDGEPEADATIASYLTYKAHGGSDPISITKPSTPIPSGRASPEELGAFTGISESPGNIMDIDVPMYTMGSPSVSAVIPPPQAWRQTPPPTASSAVRTAKRKYDDRFEPYAPSAKRRAVSPSISQLKDREGNTLVSPIIIPRSPILKPRKSFSQSQNSSAASSPTVAQTSLSHYYHGGGGPFSLPTSQGSNGNGSDNGYSRHHRSGSSSSVIASPTVRSMILASPILRPVPRLADLKRAGDEEKIVDGAGENLKDLNIGR